MQNNKKHDEQFTQKTDGIEKKQYIEKKKEKAQNQSYDCKNTAY